MFMQKVRDPRPWYRKGKVLCLCRTSFEGISYHFPIRPFDESSYWDKSLYESFVRKGDFPIIKDYGYIYDIPDFYNEILHFEQLDIIF